MLLEMLYPNRCPACDELVEEAGFCPRCRKTIRIASEPVCRCCGKKLKDDRFEFCYDCRIGKHDFDEARSVYIYEGGMKKSMYRFKYSNRRAYAKVYAAHALKAQELWLERIRPEVIVPVPMYKPKERTRGYNQAESFARALAERLGVEVRTDLLVRRKETRAMKTMSREERRNNLLLAFQGRECGVNLKRVLIVDDIYTTGATADACSFALKAVGAKSVYVMCVCVGRGD